MRAATKAGRGGKAPALALAAVLTLVGVARAQQAAEVPEAVQREVQAGGGGVDRDRLQRRGRLHPGRHLPGGDVHRREPGGLHGARPVSRRRRL